MHEQPGADGCGDGEARADGQPASPPPGNPRWSVYVVRCADGTLYTGVAKDVDGRLARHNDGVGAKYTRSRLPVRLVFREEVGDQGAALRREIKIKAMPAREKRELIDAARKPLNPAPR